MADCRQILDSFPLLPLVETILSGIDEGIHVVNSDGCTVFYNQAAAKLDGLEPTEVIGRHICELFPSLSPESSTLLKVLATGQPILHQVQRFINFKGVTITTVNATFPILAGGRLIGAVEISKDVTRMQDLTEKIMDLRTELANHKSKGAKRMSGQAVYTFDDIIGNSLALQKVKQLAVRAAKSSSPILIYGETGTGKELFVQAIHNASPRRDKPFIAQNCAALPETLLEGILFGSVKGGFTGAENRPGLFELANGGTLFLDEINSLHIELQSKLLRVLQEECVRRIGDTKLCPVDVRVIAATNVDPQRAVADKLLRGDLYYRLNVIALHLPPLRERRTDLPLLIRHFIAKYNHKLGLEVKGVSSDVQNFFAVYPWPGNIRELEHAIEGAMNILDGDTILMEHLPPALIWWQKQNTPSADTTSETISLREALWAVEKQLIAKAMAKAEGNISRAAKLLGIPRQTLQYKLSEKNIGSQE